MRRCWRRRAACSRRRSRCRAITANRSKPSRCTSCPNRAPSSTRKPRPACACRSVSPTTTRAITRRPSRSLTRRCARQTETGAHAHFGAIYAALARIYRSINEYTIARDHSQKALEHYRETGDWRGLAEAYFGIALADTFEGHYEAGLENFEQALKLVGDHPAPYLLGKIYSNMAGACWFLKRPQEGIRYLEKAIGYYERTEHKASAALGYNNLGINLILVGEWDRAQAVLGARALAGLRD